MHIRRKQTHKQVIINYLLGLSSHLRFLSRSRSLYPPLRGGVLDQLLDLLGLWSLSRSLVLSFLTGDRDRDDRSLDLDRYSSPSPSLSLCPRIARLSAFSALLTRLSSFLAFFSAFRSRRSSFSSSGSTSFVGLSRTGTGIEFDPDALAEEVPGNPGFEEPKPLRKS